MLTNQVEARKAILIAEMTEEFMKEENEITSQFDNDPLLKLKSREVDLRAMENDRKREADKTKEDLERAKLIYLVVIVLYGVIHHQVYRWSYAYYL